MRVLGLVLAGGAGSRFRASGGTTPKLLTVVRGRPLVEHVLLAAMEAELDDVAIVEGDTDLSEVVPSGVTRLRNLRPEDGIASSLQVGLACARALEHDAVIVAPGDQPGTTAEAFRTLAEQPAEPPLAVATYDGVRGAPVRVHRSAWALLPDRGDEGARLLLRERPDLVREVPCPGEPWDVDTVEDLDRWS